MNKGKQANTNQSSKLPITTEQYQNAIAEMVKSIHSPQELNKIYILTNHIVKK